jgi:hypothetical protein
VVALAGIVLAFAGYPSAVIHEETDNMNEQELLPWVMPELTIIGTSATLSGTPCAIESCLFGPS